MTDQALRRADELLTELVELIETARAMPMSSSCVVPRERVLDLLDELREVLPPEMDEARALVADRDAVLSRAREQLGAARADAERTAAALVAAAQDQAAGELDAARAERARLVCDAAVVEAASAEAARLREAAQAAVDGIRAEAEQYSSTLRADAESYADQTLADLLDVLGRTSTTTEQGRQALLSRRQMPGTNRSIS